MSQPARDLDAPVPGGHVHGGRTYVRAPRPVVFPVEADVPESTRHLRLRTALFQLLDSAFSDSAWVGSDQFVYWDPTDPRRCLAPDVLVKAGGPNADFKTWKIWERGAPDVAVEIVSEFDRTEAAWDEKLERYRKSGIREVVRFDPEPTGDRHELTVYDHVDGDLVERDLNCKSTDGLPIAAECTALNAWWVVTDHPQLGRMLRLSADRDGTQLFPTIEEQREHERAAKEQERARAYAAERERDALAERVRQLEAEPPERAKQ